MAGRSDAYTNSLTPDLAELILPDHTTWDCRAQTFSITTTVIQEGHMRITPRTLYIFASTLWAEAGGVDELSARYEAAEENLTRNSDASLPARQRRWVLRLHAYEAFWSVCGKTARENTRNRSALPVAERRLGEWARYQRRFESDLALYQRIRLDISPAFEWDPQEAAWTRNMNATLAFVARTGTLPRLDANDPDQFALARWLHRQLRHIQTGLIRADRANAVRDLLARTNRQR